MNKDTKVNCDVDSCKHNKSHNCNLETLNISCTCNSDDCEHKKETICNNFSKKQ